jgi:hypothetical protein
MTNGREKSDPVIVASRPPNKAGRPGAEAEEPRDAMGRAAMSARDAAIGRREKAIADRDRARAELSARLEAWDNSPWRRLCAWVSRPFSKRP